MPGTGDPAVSQGDESESDIDLEWSGAIAPGANIYFVYTGNSTKRGVLRLDRTPLDEQIGNIISLSYGSCETDSVRPSVYDV